MASNAAPRPEKSIKLEESGLEFTMTYVLLNDILRFVGNIDEAVLALTTDQRTRNLVIRRLLTDNKKPVNEDADLIPMEEVEIDIYELDDLLAWVMEHITYFFMRMADKVTKSVGKYPDMMKQMMSSDPSETGSTASQTPTKSAGPTE